MSTRWWIGPLSLLLAVNAFAEEKPFPPVLQQLPPSCPVGPTTLCVPLDASFTTVTFGGSAGCSGPAVGGDPCQRNDDDFTAVAIALPFTFSLYGTPYTTVYINNNGNLSFGGGYCTFTPSGFPVSGFPMVAPYWADVDTRAALSGVVHYRLDANKLVVIWDHVGYYGAHDDKLSTFEVMISNGTDPALGLGNNVCFCYDDMQWTTGDASGGSGGFGGTPATVGVNKGDGTNFFQIGRFGVAGGAYDGPGGATDGVDYLDNRTICFNAGGGSDNQPPVATGFPVGLTIDLCVGDHLSLATSFTSPEVGQTTTTTINTGTLPPARSSSSSTPGNPSTQLLTFDPILADVGTYTVTYVATDDGTPPASTTVVLTINVSTCPTSAERKTWGRLKVIYR
jgi:hypothetical protein